MPDPALRSVLLIDSADMAAHICWMEFGGLRNDGVRAEPDVIEITPWPRSAREKVSRISKKGCK